MKKITKKIAILITSVAVVLMILSQILFENPLSLIYIPVWIIEARKGIDEEYNKAIKKEETNREENRVLAEKWLINTYGDIISEVTTIEFSNRSQGWGVDSVFRIESPFATGSIYVNSETKKVDGGFNLMNIKFQHLYSEWVKKQVGIKDENVEFEFTGIFDEPYIDFDKITTLSEDCREVFENTHNLFLDTINIKNITEVNDNYMDIFYNVKNNYYYNVVDLLGSPNKISLYVYFDDYRFVYNFPEEELKRVSKRNEYPDEHNGLIWSTIY